MSQQKYNCMEVYNTRNGVGYSYEEKFEGVTLDCIKHFAKTVEGTLELYSIERFYPNGTHHSITVFNNGNAIKDVYFD